MGLFDRIGRRRQEEIPSIPFDAASFVVIDTELTGLDQRHDSIISIGAVTMTGLRIDMSTFFDRLINPDALFKLESVIIHGITPSEVAGEPGITEVLSEFLTFCGDSILVGYCVDIDLGFLRRDAKKLLNINLTNPVIEIVQVYEWLRRAPGNQREGRHNELPPIGRDGLYGLANFYDIDIKISHNAVMDAFITAQVLQRLLHGLIHKGVSQTDRLLRIGDPLRGGAGQLPESNFSNF
jgi:DNA polymerase-3 subunit epsilon